MIFGFICYYPERRKYFICECESNAFNPCVKAIHTCVCVWMPFECLSIFLEKNSVWVYHDDLCLDPVCFFSKYFRFFLYFYFFIQIVYFKKMFLSLSKIIIYHENFSQFLHKIVYAGIKCVSTYTNRYFHESSLFVCYSISSWFPVCLAFEQYHFSLKKSELEGLKE